MEIKDRVIRIAKVNKESNQVDGIIIDEIGIKDGHVFHRNIGINEDIYADFEKNPDDEMYLDVFLNFHNINSRWIQYPMNNAPKDNQENERTDTSVLPKDRSLDSIQSGIDYLNELAENGAYGDIYKELAERKALIDNPLIIDVFNEAIRDDSALSEWESVYPFFG